MNRKSRFFHKTIRFESRIDLFYSVYPRRCFSDIVDRWQYLCWPPALSNDEC